MKKKINLNKLVWKMNPDYPTQESLKKIGLSNSLKAEDKSFDYYLNEDLIENKDLGGKWWCYYTGEESVNLKKESENEVRHESREEALEWTADIINQEVDLLLLKWEIYNVEQPDNSRSLNELNEFMKEEESDSLTYKSLPLYAYYKNYVFILSQREKDSKWWGTYEEIGITIYPTPFFDFILYPYFKTKLLDSREEALEELQKLINKKLIIEEDEDIEEEDIKEEDNAEEDIEEKENFFSLFFSNKGYQKIFSTPKNSAFTGAGLAIVGILGTQGFDIGYLIGAGLGGAIFGLGIYYIQKYFKRN